MEIIKKDKYCRNKNSGELFLILYESRELVTYQSASGTPVPVRKLIFIQDFERCDSE